MSFEEDDETDKEEDTDKGNMVCVTWCSQCIVL